MKYQITILFLTLFSLGNATAQLEMGLHSMTEVWNANQTNPAFMPDKKVTIGLVSLRNNLFLTGPVYSDFIVEENGRTLIDFNRAIAAMEDQNIVRNDFALETLSAAFRVNENLMISVGHTSRVMAYANYSKGLPQVLYQGNAQFIGETVDLSNDFVLNSYNEFAVGVAYNFKILTFGVKAKYLSGFQSAATDPNRNQASLFTDSDIYQVTLNSNYRLNSSGPIEFNGFDEFDADFDFRDIGKELFTQNTGWAFDIGMTANLTEKLSISASAIDLGSIDWEEEVKNFTSNGTFLYDGLDVSDAINDNDNEDPEFGNVLDTLENIFQAVETSEGYSIDLPKKLYLDALYDVTDRLTLGATYFQEEFQNETFQALGFSGRFKAAKFITIGATYSTLLEEEKHFNLGLNGVLNLGPVQLFGVTDNIVGIFNSDDTNYLSGRIGLNLQFGKIKLDETVTVRYF